MDQLIVIDNVVNAIQNDVKAAKGLRAQLSNKDKKKKNGADIGSGLMPLFFHLLDNVIGNVNRLVEAYTDSLISQVPA